MGEHRVVVAVADGVESLDAVGPFEVFRAAARGWRGARYRVELASPDGADVRSESGLVLGVDGAWSRRRAPIDTLVVAGGAGMRGLADDPRAVRRIAALAARSTRVCSVCTGAALLAAAGVLDGRQATTHWAYAGDLATRHPRVHLEPDRIYVRDGHVWTSAGVTAGMDLALALVAEDHGPEAAHLVASWLVLFVRRAGGQSQFSAQLRAGAPTTRSLRSLLAWLPDHLDEDLSVAALAQRAGMSPRTFARAFRAETGTTPAAHVDDLRVEAARRLLETTDLTVDAIARRVGVPHGETLHRAFRRRLGTTPHAYRTHFGRIG